MPTILELPIKKSFQDYSESIARMVSKLEDSKEILSIYQIGGVSSPGISDIDMVVVFKNNSKYLTNPIDNISNDDRYLFIHQLYGCSEESINLIEKFSFFHNYKLLSGKQLFNVVGENSSEQKALKKQIALEYLFKMYVNASLQKAYNILKVRSLLLHVKALKYDLEFLEITNGPLYEKVNELMNIREEWFTSNQSVSKITSWFPTFYQALEEFLKEQTDGFYLEKNAERNLAKNITLNHGSIAWKREGFLFPKVLMNEKHYFKLLNKFNKFNFNYPYKIDCKEPIILNYLSFRKSHSQDNNCSFPYFFPLLSSLKA